MATNKHAVIRYKVLDRCFSNKWKRYYIDDLIDVCAKELSDYNGIETRISRRQILEDINFMKSDSGYLAPVESIKDGRKVYYQYNPIHFSINNQPINESELEQIKLVLNTLSRVKGLPQMEWVANIHAKLESTFFNSRTEHSIIGFDENIYLTGLTHLESLYHHIINQEVIKIKYQGFKQVEPILYQIHPYYLKQFNNRWFLFGLNHSHSMIQNLALDRIQMIRNEPSISYLASDLDFDEYFEDIIGVTYNELSPIENVRLKFNINRLPYIKSKPIHGSQKIKDQHVELLLKINPELISLLLSFGSDVEVIEPLTLRQQIMDEFKKSISNYI